MYTSVHLYVYIYNYIYMYIYIYMIIYIHTHTHHILAATWTYHQASSVPNKDPAVAALVPNMGSPCVQPKANPGQAPSLGDEGFPQL